MPPSPRSSGSSSSSSSSSEAGGGGALAQHDVERLLDVVGVQLLVEVDDVVVLLVGRRGGSPSTHGDLEREIAVLVDVELVVVDEDVVIVIVVEVVGVERVLVEVVLVEVLVVEVRLVVELVVAHQCLRERVRQCVWRAVDRAPANRRCFPAVVPRRVGPPGRAEYNAACAACNRHASTRRVSAVDVEAVGRTGPGDRWGRWVARPARGRRVIAAFSTWSPGQPPAAPPSPCPLTVWRSDPAARADAVAGGDE